MKTAILLGRCPDAKGIVARTTGFVHQYEGNLLHADHHADAHSNTSFIRLEWEWDGFLLDVSQLPARIAFVAGNHKDAEGLARHYGVDFHHFPVPVGDIQARAAAEDAILALAKENDIRLLVLARWMQILTPEFLERSEFPVINIHHSFLPAFKGGRPYHQAAERGVKLIGATSHYVTEDLDEGPIIEQDVARVSHRDDAEALAHKGRNLERQVLAKAVQLHLQHRVLRYGNRTVVFN